MTTYDCLSSWDAFSQGVRSMMMNDQVISIYSDALAILQNCQCEFMIGGGYAVVDYTGVPRATKDLDIFCRPQEYPKILKCFADHGYRTELTDSRWLAKVFKDDYFIDVIFDTVNNICKVDVQNRERYDGADINHLLLKAGRRLDWARLWKRMDTHWHLLLAQLLIFQFVYPSEYRNIVPDWLFLDLLDRAKEQYDLPPTLERVCQRPLNDHTQDEVDIKMWNYKAYTIKTV